MRQAEASPDSGSRKPVVLDLLCGAGGMSLGFQMPGYSIGLGVDSDPLACQTHAHNLGGRCVEADIGSITNATAFVEEHGLENVDVIIGGPPCQGFSRVRRGKLRSLKRDPTYIHDPRNQCYKEFIRVVDVLRPRYFVVENVPDMQYYADGDGLLLEKALRRCRELEYTLEWRVLHADRYGVPQTRRRLFIIGNALGQEIRWPDKTHEDRAITADHQWQCGRQVEGVLRSDAIHCLADPIPAPVVGILRCQVS